MVPALPEWLPRFELAGWIDEAEQPPGWWAHDVAMYRHIRARRRWMDAGQAWLAKRGLRARWYELTRPQVVSR